MKQQAKAASLGERQAAAEQLAIRALGFLAGDAEELGRFLALTGIAPGDIRTAAREPSFLAGVLEYICAHEPLLLAFAHDSAVEPSEIAPAMEALAGKRWSRDLP